jgi:hypothetical protein
MDLIYIDYKISIFLNNKSRKQVLLKLIDQNGVQKYFSLENSMK